MNWSVKTVNQIELKWSPYWFLILVNSGFRNINLAANIPLLFTSCSRILKCLIVDCPVWSTVQNISQSKKTCFPPVPGHGLEKNTRNLNTFFSFLFQQKIRPPGLLYGRLCRTRAFCVQCFSGPQCYLSSLQLFQQERWSSGCFNCISTVSCKGSVCLEVLASVYGTFFAEEGQFMNSKSLHIVPQLRRPFFFIYWPRLAFGVLNLPEVNQFTGNCFRMVQIVLKITFLKLSYPNGGRLPLWPIMALGFGITF